MKVANYLNGDTIILDDLRFKNNTAHKGDTGGLFVAAIKIPHTI